MKVNPNLRRFAVDWSLVESWAWRDNPMQYLAMQLNKVGADRHEQLWRVEETKAGVISATCIDLPISDSSDTEMSFASWDAVPQWLQDRVRALAMISGKPPTDWVDGLGRRISERVYWVVK